MTNKQILTKAIEKAVKNGWIPQGMENTPELRKPNEIIANFFHQNTFLFYHSFAKAFWGERKARVVRYYSEYMDGDFRHTITAEEYKNGTPDGGFHFGRSYKIMNVGWQYQIKQMVLEEEPLLYLKKFL